MSVSWFSFGHLKLSKLTSCYWENRLYKKNAINSFHFILSIINLFALKIPHRDHITGKSNVHEEKYKFIWTWYSLSTISNIIHIIISCSWKSDDFFLFGKLLCCYIAPDIGFDKWLSFRPSCFIHLNLSLVIDLIKRYVSESLSTLEQARHCERNPYERLDLTRSFNNTAGALRLIYYFCSILWSLENISLGQPLICSIFFITYIKFITIYLIIDNPFLYND